jgi:hypothetical protein
MAEIVGSWRYGIELGKWGKIMGKFMGNIPRKYGKIWPKMGKYMKIWPKMGKN